MQETGKCLKSTKLGRCKVPYKSYIYNRVTARCEYVNGGQCGGNTFIYDFMQFNNLTLTFFKTFKSESK